MKISAFVLFSIAFLSQRGSAETLAKAGRFGGITIRYKIILPAGYDAGRAYPAILAFAGGRQNLDAVNNMLDRNWRAEAEKRGYIVVSPVAPSNNLFFERGADGAGGFECAGGSAAAGAGGVSGFEGSVFGGDASEFAVGFIGAGEGSATVDCGYAGFVD